MGHSRGATLTAFGKLWETGQLDTINIGGTDFAPHMYASPLYVDQVLLTGGQFVGQQLSAVVAATGNGYVYAVNALEAPGVPRDRPHSAPTNFDPQRVDCWNSKPLSNESGPEPPLPKAIGERVVDYRID